MNERRESLESLLSNVPRIDDNGFTETLMARLPPSQPSLRVRMIILFASAVTSCSVVAAVPGVRHFLAEISVGFVDGLAATGSSLIATGIVAALVVWGAMAAAASEV